MYLRAILVFLSFLVVVTLIGRIAMIYSDGVGRKRRMNRPIRDIAKRFK